MPSNYGYLTKVAIIQKFFDQSISTNTNYDPERFPNGKVPMETLLDDLLTAYQLGIKTLYYHNTRRCRPNGRHQRRDQRAPG
jgi:ribonucleoside-diphosphate reductase alpha chain